MSVKAIIFKLSIIIIANINTLSFLQAMMREQPVGATLLEAKKAVKPKECPVCFLKKVPEAFITLWCSHESCQRCLVKLHSECLAQGKETFCPFCIQPMFITNPIEADPLKIKLEDDKRFRDALVAAHQKKEQEKKQQIADDEDIAVEEANTDAAVLAVEVFKRQTFGENILDQRPDEDEEAYAKRLHEMFNGTRNDGDGVEDPE